MIHRDWENKKLVRRVRVNVNRTPKRRYFTNVYFSIRRLNVCESKHAHVCVKFTTLDEWFIVFWHWSVPFLICCVWWTSKRGSWLREACWCKVSAKSSKKKKKRHMPRLPTHTEARQHHAASVGWKTCTQASFCVHVNKDGKHFSLWQRASCYT